VIRSRTTSRVHAHAHAVCEDIKIKYACALSQLANPMKPSRYRAWATGRPAGGAPDLAEIVEPRYEELFALVRDELRRAGLEERWPPRRTDGGKLQDGRRHRTRGRVFHMPVRLGVPQYVSGLVDVVSNPIHATGVGLLLYAKSNMDIRRAEGPLLAGGVNPFSTG